MSKSPEDKLAELLPDPWFAFEGDVRIKALEPRVIPEPPRHGEGGIECRNCTRPDSDYIWSNDRWRLWAYTPTTIPGVVLLEPRAHFDSFADMPADLLAEVAVMIKRVELACLAATGAARIHVGRYGDGAEHFHLWFFPRPLGALQLRGSMLPVWMDVLPDITDDESRAALDAIVAQLTADGGEH